MKLNNRLRKKQDGFLQKKSSYFLIYTLVFVVMTFLTFYSFIKTNTSFVWISTGAGKDGFQQHSMALMYYGQWLREIVTTLFTEGRLVIPMWDFSIGYGSDIIPTMHYYVLGDPLNLISVAVPSKYYEYLYSFIIILRLYLSGITFSLFCFKMNKGKMATFAGAFAYAFSGHALYAAVRHPFFVNSMIYIPLLFLGAEKILRKERPLLFVLMVFVCASSSFYFLYMSVAGVVIYFAIRYFTMERERNVKDFFINTGKFAGCGLLGIGMASFIFIPVVNVLMSSHRLEETGGSLEIFYNPSFYESYVTTFFAAGPMARSTGIAFTAVMFVALAVLFMTRKKYKGLKIATVLFVIMTLFPIFGKIMNGFAYSNNRWTFLLAGLMALVLTSVWEDMLTLSKKKLMALSVCIVVYMILLIIFDYRITDSTIPVFIGILIVSIFLILYIEGPLKILSKKAVSLILICFILANICMNGYFVYDKKQGNYISQFLKWGEAYEKVDTSTDKAAAKLVSEDEFARNEQSKTNILNASVITGATGTQYYWSFENSNISNFLLENGKNSMMPQMYDGLDSRVYLDALASVKYFVYTTERNIPYGFKEKGTVSSGKKTYPVYENKYALPLGYTYSSYVDKAEYDKLKVYEKQQVGLQGVVIEDTEALKNYKKADLKLTQVKPEYDIKLDKSIIVQDDGTYVVNKAGAKMVLTFEGLPKSETYFYIQDMHGELKNKYQLYMDDCQEFFSKEEFNKLSKEEQERLKKKDFYQTDDSGESTRTAMYVESDSITNKLNYINEEYKYASGQNDFMVNMGYSKKPQKKFVVTFKSAGEYTFGEMGIVCQPLDEYPQQINALKEDVMENEVISTNKVEGEISLDEDKILCLSIPYSAGWSATVDGKDAELLQANTMYMALPLEKGNHKIVLTYKTPLITEGLLVSIASLVVYLTMVILYVVVGKKKRKKLS